ncbi:MAG: DUF1836 domain-containing protein [Ruminococcaceae bacterium]|nr:DUF1836 domain-containing protein [Oscillospiraceae bacterium]
MPRYQEIPNVGLYLEQVTRYIGECFAPLMDGGITASMISNYVKRGLVSNPVKKQYSREQIACLIYITAVKTVLTMENIRLMFRIQKDVCEMQIAYDYFCDGLETMLFCVSSGEEIPALAAGATEEMLMLHNTVVAVAHTICLRKRFAVMQQLQSEEKEDVQK